MNETINLLVPIIVSAITSFIVAKYYGERWVETRHSRREHSLVLKDEFFKPWLEKIGEHTDAYCSIDVRYSKKTEKMVALPPREPDDLKFFAEATHHLKSYERFLEDYKKLRQTTLEQSEKLSVLFEKIRVLIARELVLPYWCPRSAGEYSGDKPNEYLCPDLFTRSIYDELLWRMETRRKQYFGNGTITPTIESGEKKIFYLRHGYAELAGSADEELVNKAQQLFSKIIEDEEFGAKIKSFIDEKRDTYDKELEKVKSNILDIIKSIELGNVVKGKCRFCP
jgi:hypothetical protein